jgi:ribosomal protein S18 acetylase RimI-like enzyme
MAVIALSEEHAGMAADTLARAFLDDAGMVYLIPDESQRAKLVPAWMRVITRYGLQHGQVYTTANTEAVAIWLGPEEPVPDEGKMKEVGMDEVAQLCGEEVMERFHKLAGTIDELHTRLMPGPQYHLFFLGTAPEAQGRGAGTELIESFLSEHNDLPCCLETLTPQNVEFYKKRGFRVAGETDVPDSDVHVWTMVRDL